MTQNGDRKGKISWKVRKYLEMAMGPGRVVATSGGAVRIYLRIL
jgi:hypothetical protein